ncbi:hypothetical protein EKO23_06820, partial [Nocardioides guangzhouensis]
MTRIEMRLEGLPDLHAFVELVGPDLDTRKMRLTSAESASIEVVPGENLVRTHWSNGRTDQQVMSVGDEPEEWILEQPDSVIPGLLQLGDPIEVTVRPPAPWNIGDAADFELRLEPATKPSRDFAVRMQEALPTADHAPSLPETLELWRRESDRSWVPVPLDSLARPIDAGVEFELAVGEGLHVIKAGGQGVHQFVSLPSERSVVGIRWSSDGGTPTIRVDARTADPEVEALRGFLARGEIEVARALAAGALAERLLQAKVAAPRIAALGAYALLRLGDLERLHNWPDNLTRWKPWLPDGPVIAAWQRLRSPEPDYEEACALLLEAETRGIPVYTEGVRLLKDGLDVFDTDERDWHVHEAARRVEAFAQALAWDKSETTYFGIGPQQPRAAVADNTLDLLESELTSLELREAKDLVDAAPSLRGPRIRITEAPEPRHGRETFFIEGEGVVGDEASDLGAAPAPPTTPPPGTTARAAAAAPVPDFRFSRMGPVGKKVGGPIRRKVAVAMTSAPMTQSTIPAGYTYLGQFVDH